MTTRSPLCVFVVNRATHIEPDSTTAILIARMAECGHRVVVASVDALGIDPSNSVRVRGYPVRTEQIGDDPISLHLVRGDLVVVRTNPARDALPSPLHELALDILAMAQAEGVVVVNDPAGLRRAGTKLYTCQIPARMRPRTLVSRDARALRAFVEAGPGPSILKPVVGTRGTDVFKVASEEPNLNQIIEVLTRGGMAIAQSFVPEASEGDVRVLVLDGEALRVAGHVAAVRRVPSGGDFRSNVHVGATPEAAAYAPVLRNIVETVGPMLARDGLSLCGLDIIGAKIVEINVFSAGGVQDANRLFGVDFITPILASLERRLEAGVAE